MVDLSKYKDIYVNEVTDHLQKLNDNLLILEKNPENKDVLDELMRSSHTIKGSSATMGFVSTAFLAHIMEDIFDYARKDVLKIDTKIINEAFTAVDTLEKSVKSVEKKGEENNCDDVANKIKEITGVSTEGVGKSKKNEKDLEKIKKKLNNKVKAKSEPKKKEENQPENIDEIVTKLEEITHIKVPVKRLDVLMDLMEELLIDRMKLNQLAKNNPKLEELSNHLSRLISDIQYQVMQVRLVPLEQIFGRFPRMIRDLSQKQNKKINLDILGADLELDRTIVDKLGEPLVHLLRNAVDHGIEKKGNITIKAKRENEFALISVEDDGAGINLEKIKEEAVSRKIIDNEDLKNLEKDKIIDLIFNPRLSTKKEITETSGRGVGLSVVKSFAEQIGGRAIVESGPSQKGTRFTLELPLTLAIINVLLVESSGFTFAVPFSNIERSVRVSRDKIRSMADQDVAVIDDDYVPLARLDKIFELTEKIQKKPEKKEENTDQEENKSEIKKEDPQRKEDKKRKTELIIIVKRGRDKAGIVVDNLISEEEIIVKPLPSVLRNAKGSSGSTILGNGKTILIIDVVTLLEEKRKLLRV